MPSLNLKLDRPLIVFDIESTGVSPRQDRIIELAAIKVTPEGDETTKCWLLNPTVPIPEDSTKIHGITDEDVRDSAMNEWSMALSDIDDEGEKLGVVEMAMGVLTNEDALEDISGEYIGADEKLAVESLLRIIEGGGSEEGIAKAKETYEFVTGDEFAGRAAAEKWIAEEYQPPDPPPPQEQAK